VVRAERFTIDLLSEHDAAGHNEKGCPLTTHFWALSAMTADCRFSLEADLASCPHLLIKQIGTLRGS